MMLGGVVCYILALLLTYDFRLQSGPMITFETCKIHTVSFVKVCCGSVRFQCKADVNYSSYPHY